MNNDLTQDRPLTIQSFPRAIIHIDGDAFFASCEQARNPRLKGKPVVTGKERGIAASMSYEAKALGVTRGMRLFEIKKICPEAIILPSDYETYSLLSCRFYEIVRRYTPDVEEYSIDECFADLTGLRRHFRKGYDLILEDIKRDLDSELGFTFSAGLGPNKVIAKIGSKWKKPSGLTVIPGYNIHFFLAKLHVGKIWGIGPQTSAYLEKQGVRTALEFARKDEHWVKRHLSKPYYEIWQELNGHCVLELETQKKETYKSVQKVKTFTPPSNDRDFVFAQLSKNVENACIKLRRYRLAATKASFFLTTQNFRFAGFEVKFAHATCAPNEILELIERHFGELFRADILYRATGIALYALVESQARQLDLFGKVNETLEWQKLFETVDKVNAKYGKHTLFLLSSLNAHKFGLHEGERGDKPERTLHLLKGETKRRRLAIPMLMGELR
jgi:DNA polymerase-4